MGRVTKSHTATSEAAAVESSGDVETIESLVEALNLAGITYYSMNTELREGDASEFGGEDDDVNAEFGFRTRHNLNEFGVRIRVDLETVRGRASVDVSVEYAADRPVRIPKEVAYEFINNVALMQVYPYLREAVMTNTSRVFGAPVLLPLFMRGQLRFEVDENGPAISEGIAGEETAEG